MTSQASPRERQRSAVLPALFFVLGLSTVFLLMGYAASAFGRAFLQYQPLLVKLSGAFVILLGLHFLHVFRIPLLDREARLDTGEQGGSALGAYLRAATKGDRKTQTDQYVVEFDGGYAVFDADTDEAAQDVLRRAVAAGAVTSFAPRHPTLAQIFKEVIQ